MATLIKTHPRLELIGRGPDGKMRVQYRLSGPEWLFPDTSRPSEQSWGKWERPRAIVLPFVNPRKKALKV
jgi:hypothetical protein